jgi:predicted TIM-barrel fold metal-dependent hydrolase
VSFVDRELLHRTPYARKRRSRARPEVGAGYFVWASDYPHIDASLGVVGEIRSRITTVSEQDQAKVLGLNAQRFYGLEVPALI